MGFKLSELILSLSFLPRVFGGGGFVLNDYRAQSRDVSPELGRGYSFAADTFYSKCLSFEDTTATSFDYDFVLSQVKPKDGDDSYEFSRRLNEKYSYPFLLEQLASSREMDSSSTVSRSSHFVVVMSLDRYHKSIDESGSVIVPEAIEMIERGELVGFFTLCGPSYVRTIRRLGEVAILFSWQVKYVRSTYNVKYANMIEDRILAVDESHSKVDQMAEIDTTTIRIRAFGIDLNRKDVKSSSFIMTSMKNLREVFDTSYKSMQKDNIGIVASIEVLPWTMNVDFQASVEFTTVASTTVPPMTRKFNLVSNSEHIVKLYQNLLDQFASVTDIQECLSIVSGLPTSHDDRYLVNQRCVYDDRCPTKTVSELKCDLLGELAPSTRLTNRENNIDKYVHSRRFKNLSRYIAGYFRPCIQVLSREDDGLVSGYMFTHHWTSVPECQQIECTFPNIIYDEVTNTCTPGTFYDLAGIVDQFCPIELSSGTKEASDVCPGAMARTDVCEQSPDAENTVNHHVVRYYINTDENFSVAGGQCSSCDNDPLLELKIPSNEGENFKIEGAQRDGYVFPREKKTCLEVKEFTDDELTVKFHRNTCDCDEETPEEYIINQQCKVSPNVEFCVQLGPTNIV